MNDRTKGNHTTHGFGAPSTHATRVGTHRDDEAHQKHGVAAGPTFVAVQLVRDGLEEHCVHAGVHPLPEADEDEEGGLDAAVGELDGGGVGGNTGQDATYLAGFAHANAGRFAPATHVCCASHHVHDGPTLAQSAALAEPAAHRSASPLRGQRTPPPHAQHASAATKPKLRFVTPYLGHAFGVVAYHAHEYVGPSASHHGVTASTHPAAVVVDVDDDDDGVGGGATAFDRVPPDDDEEEEDAAGTRHLPATHDPFPASAAPANAQGTPSGITTPADEHVPVPEPSSHRTTHPPWLVAHTPTGSDDRGHTEVWHVPNTHTPVSPDTGSAHVVDAGANDPSKRQHTSPLTGLHCAPAAKRHCTHLPHVVVVAPPPPPPTHSHSSPTDLSTTPSPHVELAGRKNMHESTCEARWGQISGLRSGSNWNDPLNSPRP